MAGAEPQSELLSAIVERLGDEEISSLTKRFLKKFLKGKRLTQDDKRDQAFMWLRWARSNPHLKVVSASVPVGILPDGIQGELLDVKVSCRGPDDIIFDQHSEIRTKVARGNCFLEITDGAHAGTTCITYALKKFTGGLGDDDDRDKGDNHTWKQYFTKPFDEAKTVVGTRKANGEAAHLAARKINGSYVLFGGSKNVHMAFTSRADIRRYGNEMRYTIASEVSETIMDLLESMDTDDKNLLLEFLSVTEFTAIFEILSPKHQHVEDLSHLNRPLLQFITWTVCDLDPPIESLLSSMPPHVAIEIARALRVPTVDYKVIPVSEVGEHMMEVRLGYGYEGEVLYFLDAQSSVIGLLKKKTIWYILCRAIREKVRNAAHARQRRPADFSVNRASKKLQTRVEEIQSWLGLDNESTQAWKTLGTDYLKWCLHNVEQGSLMVQDIADLFPVTWRRFLEETSTADKIQPEWREPDGSDD